jgi:hypothetical protein
VTSEGNRRYAEARRRALEGRADPQTAGRVPARLAAAMRRRADEVAPRTDPELVKAGACECTGDDPLEHLGSNHMMVGQGRGRPKIEVCTIATGSGRCECPGFRPRAGSHHETV